MAPSFGVGLLLRRSRPFCTKSSGGGWNAAKRVTRSNFVSSVEELRADVSNCDYIALSLKQTGSASAVWQRVGPYDTAETAYLKAKRAARKYQVLQFDVCPFSIRESRVAGTPYNFLLFPRDELRTGMPSYSFSCETSILESLLQENFDFNACIYDGITYSSRDQEPAARIRLGNPVHCSHIVKSPASLSVADAVFVGRIKSRIQQWKDSCKDSTTKTDQALSFLRQLALGGEKYASRPCMNIDVCSERQVQLVLEILLDHFEELVPLIIPAKGGGTQAVRIVLTSSKEDKFLLERELQTLEDEQSRRVRGFREVIDLISASQKPILSHNSLHDFTFIYNMFIAPLPSNMDEFRRSLSTVFPQIFDTRLMMEGIVPPGKLTNISSVNTCLKNRSIDPIIIMEVLSEGDGDEAYRGHGHPVVTICNLFAKLCSTLKLRSNTPFPDACQGVPALGEYANKLGPCLVRSNGSPEESIRGWTSNPGKISTEDIVFLWGFSEGVSTEKLKAQLEGSHDLFSESEDCFSLQLVDRSCAIVVFSRPGLAGTLLSFLSSREVPERLRGMVSEGLKGASYEAYKRICRLEGSWECVDLRDAFDEAFVVAEPRPNAEPGSEILETYRSSDYAITLDEL